MSKETVIMFFLILAEYACFPVSSEVVLPLSGAAAKGMGIPFLFTLILSVIAGVIGVCITYAIGRYGGSPLLEHLMKRFPSTKKPILSSYRFFGDHGRAAVCFGRLVPLCRTYISFIAGATNQNFTQYLLFSATGITLWNSVLLGIGYYFMRYKDILLHYFEKYKLLIIFAAGTIFVLFLIRKIMKTKDDSDQQELE